MPRSTNSNYKHKFHVGILLIVTVGGSSGIKLAVPLAVTEYGDMFSARKLSSFKIRRDMRRNDVCSECHFVPISYIFGMLSLANFGDDSDT